MLYAGMVLKDRYEIRKVIGHGGMSTVYQARDVKTGQLLAVKDVERTGKSQNQVVEQSLVGEGKMLKQLSNSHLPRIYDIVENPENFMLIMDFIEGESLDKVIARTGPQNMDQVLDWGMQICEVFHYLHTQPIPIIYRDMKPANVILRPDGTLMMIDFGTARTQKLGVQMQADTTCIGTAGFAAPEQYGGYGQSDARTDIFCLGATLYNMITGHSPCDRPTGILPLEQWNPDLGDTPIAQIIYKCTRNDPNERYQTAMELFAELQLARSGAFGKTGLSGRLGGFRKTEWQKQDLKGGGMIGSGLSALIQRTLTPEPKQEAPAQPAPEKLQWKAPAPEPMVQAPVQQSPEKEVLAEEDNVWHKVMLIAVILAAVFVVLSCILIFSGSTLAGGVFLIIAVGAACLAVVGLILSRRQQPQEEEE